MHIYDSGRFMHMHFPENLISFLLALILASMTSFATAQEPTIVITFDGHKQQLSRTELLKHPALQAI